MLKKIECKQGQIKWFNFARGFGFVKLEAGEGEAYLSRRVLSEQYNGPPNGEEVRGVHLTCSVERRSKGPYVSKVLTMGRRPKVELPGKDHYNPPVVVGAKRADAQLKFYNPAMQYGFLLVDGESDIYFHMQLAASCGLSEKEVMNTSTFLVTYGLGSKGPVATKIEVRK